MVYVKNPKTGYAILVNGPTYKKLKKEGYKVGKLRRLSNRSRSPKRHPKDRKKVPSLYERLGGIYAIAAVVDLFSDNIIINPVIGQLSPNPCLRQWHTQSQIGYPDSNGCGRCGSLL